jgi:uncharacterized protein
MALTHASEVPEALIRRVVEVWHPQEIRLFGSRARGDFHELSDWDLLVIVPDDAPAEQFDLVWARRAVRDLHLRVDVVPVSRSEFEEGRRWIGTLAELVEREGVRVYG